MTTHTPYKCSQHKQIKKHAANNILYLVVLWSFAVRFFIRLCCEHLHSLLSNWRRCFLDLLVLFLFPCVFWSCSALSSLGHRREITTTQNVINTIVEGKAFGEHIKAMAMTSNSFLWRSVMSLLHLMQRLLWFPTPTLWAERQHNVYTWYTMS